MPKPAPIAMNAGTDGPWRVTSIAAIIGESLPMAPRLRMDAAPDPAAHWCLRGVSSNMRYTAETERQALVAVQAGLGRPLATRGSLIPIRKTEAWWELAQDTRRQIMEEQSRHIGIGLEYLPGVARKLIHCRDVLGEPFDFLTWFEFAPEDEAAFDALLVRLRATPEWAYVDREVELRLARD